MLFQFKSLLVLTVAAAVSLQINAFVLRQCSSSKSLSSVSTSLSSPKRPRETRLFLQTGLQIPLLNVLDENPTDAEPGSITPLPSSHLPATVATPFVYGMQVERPVHKLLLEEAINSVPQFDATPIYGHLVWKDPSTDSLVGAIGCTADILVNAPTTDVLDPLIAQDLQAQREQNSESLDSSEALPPSETPATTLLCRGGFRFVVREVVKSIPFPIAIVDEIEDDAEEDDSDMFASFAGETAKDDDDDDEDAKYASMSPSELLQKTMLGVQAVVSQKLAETRSKQISPLEKQILENSGIMVDPNAMERMRAEEMVAVWEVFQESLVDEISPSDRKYAVAMMAAELGDMDNRIRQRVLLTRDSQDRLRIVLKELDEMVGMAKARKIASQITEEVDEGDRDLKVGVPQLPPWARSIVKGTRVEYFWNEEYGWCGAQVVEDPVTVVDEILLTVRFDEDDETHTLPLSADEKVRWRPPEN